VDERAGGQGGWGGTGAARRRQVRWCVCPCDKVTVKCTRVGWGGGCGFLGCGYKECRKKFSKVPFIVALHSVYTRLLTFEIFFSGVLLQLLQEAIVEEGETVRQEFLKSPLFSGLHSSYTRSLTFENVCQLGSVGGARLRLARTRRCAGAILEIIEKRSTSQTRPN
jgi:hypothetical protein